MEVDFHHGDAPMSTGSDVVTSVGTETAATAVATVAVAAAATTAATASTASQALQTSLPAVATAAAAQTTAAVPPQLIAWDAHLDVVPKEGEKGAEPWLSADMQLARRMRLGLCAPRAIEFIERTEFISIGCFCAISRSLQSLGIKKYSYPFDWTRTSLDSICHCLDTDFQDFLTYSSWRQEGDYTVFGGTAWGGSFWHHDLEAPSTRMDFSRRIDRLCGRGEVPAKTPRMFIRSVNATKEIRQTPRLLDALRRALPEAQIKLLLIVDVQRIKGPLQLLGELGEHIFVYRIHESLYKNPQAGMPLQECSEAYAEAIAYGIGHWSGSFVEQPQFVPPETAEDLSDLSSKVEHWDGGNAAEQLFCPRRFRGQQLVLPGNKEYPGLLERYMVSNLWLPEGVIPDTTFHTYAFGKQFSVRLPPGSVGGQLLQVGQNEGVLSAIVYSLSEGLAKVIGEAVVLPSV